MSKRATTSNMVWTYNKDAIGETNEEVMASKRA